MTNFNSQPYRDATTVCNLLLERMQQQKTDDKDMALLAREWVGVMMLKRLMRGLPPLKAVSLKEVMDARKANTKHAEPTDAFIELDPAPTELTTPPTPTVTAPPTP